MVPTLLADLLSEVHKSLRDKISNTLLVPTMVAAAVLAFIHGATYGWDWYATLWNAAGAVERVLLVAAVALGLFFVMLALDSLSPLVDRTFQSGIIGTQTALCALQRAEWRRRKQRKDEWEAIYKRFDAQYPLEFLAPPSPRAKPNWGEATWDTRWAAKRPEPGSFCHIRLTPGTTTRIAFNCEMTDERRLKLPPGIAPGDCARVLYTTKQGVFPKAPYRDGAGQPAEVAARETTVTVRYQRPYVAGEHVAIISRPSRTRFGRRSDPIVRPAIVQEFNGNTGRLKVLVVGETIPSAEAVWTTTDFLHQSRNFPARLVSATSYRSATEAARDFITALDVAAAYRKLDGGARNAGAFLRKMESEKQDTRQAIQYWVDRSRQEWNLHYPANPNQVVATSYGNIVQTIASHGHEVYGMHTPVMLSRLIKLVDAKVLAAYSDAQERIALLEWSFLSGLVIAIAGSWMLFASGAPWWQPILLYLVAGLLVPLACLHGLGSAALRFAEEAKFLIDTQRGLVFDAMGVARPDADTPTDLYGQERAAWTHTGQWLQYGGEDYRPQIPDYTIPPTGTAKPPADDEGDTASPPSDGQAPASGDALVKGSVA
jgi:hypothetical protein